MSLTIACVGNKGTHTLGDGDSNGTNHNESFVNVPGANTVTGQRIHFDPSVAANTIAADGGTSTNNFLLRFYAAKLPASQEDANYVTPTRAICHSWNVRLDE